VLVPDIATAGRRQLAMEGLGAEIRRVREATDVPLAAYNVSGEYAMIKAAAGQGIISSLVLLSDDLDEIDWEIMGGNTSFVENNYYGKGNQSERNAKYVPLAGAQEAFHNYTVDWTQERLEWSIDGQVVRTLSPGDAHGSYPQTPSYFKMGIWAGGDPKEPEGVREWAGGDTDYSKGPFTMTIANLTIHDYTTKATKYSYGDHSGSWESIKVDKTGPSNQAQIAQAPPPETVAQKWSGYSTGAKIAIIVAPSAVAGLLAIVGIICCFKQRALGRRERAIEDAMWEKRNAEMMAYRRQLATGNFAQTFGSQRQGGAYQPVPPRSPLAHM